MELRFLTLTGELHLGRTAERPHVSAVPDEENRTRHYVEKVAAPPNPP